MPYISVAVNAAYCLLVIRRMSGAWVNYRNHLAGVLDTQSSCMPLGEPETFMSTFQMTWGLDG